MAFLRAQVLRSIIGDEGMAGVRVSVGALDPKKNRPQRKKKKNPLRDSAKVKTLNFMVGSQVDLKDFREDSLQDLDTEPKAEFEQLTWEKVFKRRLVRCLVILLVIVYFNVTSRTLEGINCIKLDTGYRLYIERSSVCYHGEHLALLPFMWIVLVGYCFGFPAFCGYVCFRAYRQHQRNIKALKAGRVAVLTLTPAFREMFGYLWRGLKPHALYFRVLPFVVIFFLSMQTAFALGPSIQLFINGLVFMIDLVLAVWIWPFDSKLANFAAVGEGAGKAVSMLILLGTLEPDIPDGRAFFFVVLAILIALVGSGIGWRIWDMKKKGTGPFAKKNADKDEDGAENGDITEPTNDVLTVELTRLDPATTDERPVETEDLENPPDQQQEEPEEDEPDEAGLTVLDTKPTGQVNNNTTPSAPEAPSSISDDES